MCEWIGENGFGGIGTQARNVPISGIDKKYLHIEKHQAGCKFSKVARFTQPIVVVKDYPDFQRVHVSFQSTSSVNITTINCLNECKLFVGLREREEEVRTRSIGASSESSIGWKKSEVVSSAMVEIPIRVSPDC